MHSSVAEDTVLLEYDITSQLSVPCSSEGTYYFHLLVFSGPRRMLGTHYPGMWIVSQKNGVCKHTYDATLTILLIFQPDLLDQNLLNDNEMLRYKNVFLYGNLRGIRKPTLKYYLAFGYSKWREGEGRGQKISCRYPAKCFEQVCILKGCLKRTALHEVYFNYATPY